MNQKEASLIVRQRTAPRLYDFCFLATRAHLKVFIEFTKRLAERTEPIQLLDLGCGQKPFAVLLKDVNVARHVGVDFDGGRSKPDVVASIDELPLEDNTFDAVIASEVLEHTLKLDQAIAELRRVAKDGAIVYISTPFMFGEHGTPYDFQRITRYKYFDLFQHDEILLLRETNSNLATPVFVSNLCVENIAILKKIPIFVPLFYALNNLFALIMEVLLPVFQKLVELVFPKQREKVRKLFSIYFYTMPAGYDLIVKIKKNAP